MHDDWRRSVTVVIVAQTLGALLIAAVIYLIARWLLGLLGIALP